MWHLMAYYKMLDINDIKINKIRKRRSLGRRSAIKRLVKGRMLILRGKRRKTLENNKKKKQ